MLRTAGAEVESVTTTSHGQGRDYAHLAASSGEFDMVIAAGGDGTVHDVASGLIGTHCPLGIIPMGTANVFARELGLDFSPDALASTLISGPTRTIAVGRVNEAPFLFVAGLGFDAAAVRYFEEGNHRWFGIGGFIPPVLRSLISAPDTPLEITIDGTGHTAHWVIVTRVKHYAANILLVPEANLEDNKLHVILFSGSGIWVRMRQLSALLTGMLKFDPGVTMISCHHLTIKADLDVPVQIDGEAKGCLPLELGIYPQRLEVVCPSGSVPN